MFLKALRNFRIPETLVFVTTVSCISEANPLKGMMQINLAALAIFRVEGTTHLGQACKIDRDYTTKFGLDSTPRKIDTDFIAQYKETRPKSIAPTIVSTQQGVKKADNPTAALAGNYGIMTMI